MRLHFGHPKALLLPAWVSVIKNALFNRIWTVKKERWGWGWGIGSVSFDQVPPVVETFWGVIEVCQSGAQTNF